VSLVVRRAFLLPAGGSGSAGNSDALSGFVCTH
jgi:hypothetical protein